MYMHIFISYFFIILNENVSSCSTVQTISIRNVTPFVLHDRTELEFCFIRGEIQMNVLTANRCPILPLSMVLPRIADACLKP